jgi:hypothetical protein
MTDGQLAKWKAALAGHHRQQRNRRSRRKRGLDAATGPGMVRLTMVDTDGDHADDHPSDHPGPPSAAVALQPPASR